MPAGPTLTIDQLAATTGTTSRRIRSFQTLGLLPHPELRGRTGLYGDDHIDRVSAILRLQDRGFSLESLAVLFAGLQAAQTLADVLGMAAAPAEAGSGRPVRRPGRRGGALRLQRAGDGSLRGTRVSARPLLSIVPTTMWGESEAS